MHIASRYVICPDPLYIEGVARREQHLAICKLSDHDPGLDDAELRTQLPDRRVFTRLGDTDRT